MLSTIALTLACSLAASARPGAEVLERTFQKEIRPILKEYCLNCHSTEKQKGDLDLERFANVQAILQHPKVWPGVTDQLGLGEMPPKEKPQPSPLQREKLIAWVRDVVDEAAQARAGDPGPVVLRRLDNAEYTYTIRDITGVATLNPTREFPADSAAGEGFMNTGASLVMSPALLGKYLDAGKEIAAHAVFLPDGFRFSASTTRRDWTEEILAEIRAIYREYADASGADKVNLQGIIFDTNQGGRLPVERYLHATLELREQLGKRHGKPTEAQFAKLAADRHISAKYLASLWTVLNTNSPSPVMDPIRARWRVASTNDAESLAAAVALWQKALWKFSSVGHIGKLNGPKAWMEPVAPFVSGDEIHLKLPESPSGNEVSLYLTASDAGDGSAGDDVVWKEPRLVAAGRPTLALKDVRAFVRDMSGRRDQLFASASACLAAAAEAGAGATSGELDVPALAARHGVSAPVLGAWLGYLGVGGMASMHLTYFTNRMNKGGDYDFIKGWGSPETPLMLANSSDQNVRIPGNMNAKSVAVHPSPTLNAAVGWLSPVAGSAKVEATVTHAHPECGNGVEWFLELRRGRTRQRLAHGYSQGGKPVQAGPFENIAVLKGDLVSLLIGPRDGNHSCDLTMVELAIATHGDGGREWRLTRDVAPDAASTNPHADGFGNAAVWHFYTEPVTGGDAGPVIPAGSLLARWQAAGDAVEREKLAAGVQALLKSGPPSGKDNPDAALYRQLASLGGPLLASARNTMDSAPGAEAPVGDWGVDPARFGRHPSGGGAVAAGDLCVHAPAIIEVRLPADLAAGAEFVTTATLHPDTGREGSVQVKAVLEKPAMASGLAPAGTAVNDKGGVWTSNNRSVAFDAPLLVNEGSVARSRFEAAFEEFRRWFPAALCYAKIVPVDEVITLTLFHREDEPLSRLMLDPAEAAKLDRLWSELRFVSRDALTLVDAFEQLWQYATQDADPKVFEPLRKPIQERAAVFRTLLTNSQPAQVDAVVHFAAKAYRRPLKASEDAELRGLYRTLLSEQLPHDEAVRLLLARIFVSPSFLYRLEDAPPGTRAAPVSDYELATRLSYFLWSSSPDPELLRAAELGKLHEPDQLAAQTRRMVKDIRVRRLATEFACTWLHIHDFDTLDEKSERHFPAFTSLRGPMCEESVQFFTDAIRNDATTTDLFDADYTFLNEALAKAYGIPGVSGDAWRRVDGVSKYGRGGVLGMGATLAKHSGASRTSPILRGNWVSEVLLGDKLPKPPKVVPRLPDDEATENLTVRQLVEKHSTDPRCSGCHRRIDGFGFALEGFDAIGRARTADLAGHPIDAKSKLPDGTFVDGSAGLRHYLLTVKRDAVTRQFCRKLLGYALARGVLLSDKPLIEEMRRQLHRRGDHLSAAIETIVRSRQFREIRGLEMADAD
jgi:Protein of unknown function (DUF1592)/Protein of unknown function (DUF1588)/Protein of unknown function (DUF1587)/Protein of unknown function (DUF1585)/Protein of unknown function (DUF1595)/Planctomycete cytochrome C